MREALRRNPPVYGELGLETGSMSDADNRQRITIADTLEVISAFRGRCDVRFIASAFAYPQAIAFAPTVNQESTVSSSETFQLLVHNDFPEPTVASCTAAAQAAFPISKV